MSNAHYTFEPAGADWVGPMDRSVTRLLYASTARYGEDWHSTLHTHTCSELLYVVGGSGQFRVENHLLPVNADELVIVQPNVMHTELSFEENPLEYIVLGVKGLEFGGGDDEDDRCAIVDFKGCGGGILFYLRAILRELERKEQDYEAMCQDLLEVLLVVFRRRANFFLARLPSEAPGSKKCALVRRYIDEHFKENINLDFLAKMAHLNKYYLVHAFSKDYGISPIGHLIARRIKESCFLLSDTDHSLSQISHMLGFSSPSYFSQSFRRLQGMSPLEYRKEYKVYSLRLS